MAVSLSEKCCPRSPSSIATPIPVGEQIKAQLFSPDDSWVIIHTTVVKCFTQRLTVLTSAV